MLNNFAPPPPSRIRLGGGCCASARFCFPPISLSPTHIFPISIIYLAYFFPLFLFSFIFPFHSSLLFYLFLFFYVLWLYGLNDAMCRSIYFCWCSVLVSSRRSSHFDVFLFFTVLFFSFLFLNLMAFCSYLLDFADGECSSKMHLAK